MLIKSKSNNQNRDIIKWTQDMKKFNRIILIIVVYSTNICFAIAGSEQGNRGPLYLSTAWNLVKGDLIFQGNSRFYFNNKTFTSANNPATAVTFWDIQGGLNLNYGLGQHYQIGISQILYQDNHKTGSGYNFPDDLFLKVKVGSFLEKPGPIKFGAALTTRLPLARYHNIQLEPYSAGRVEFGILGLLSFSQNQLYPDDGLNAHLNLGIIDHNDKGKKFTESNITYVNQANSRELYGGLAAIYPMTKFDFSVELYGNYNITKPPPAAFSRHNYLYITPGINYNAFYWLSVACGFDFRLSKHQSSKSYLLPQFTANVLPTYPTWRINLSVRINFVSKLKGRFDQKENIESNASDEKKKDVYEKITEERKQIENAEEELQKIRDERKKMDEILNRLRKALEIKDPKEKTEKEKDKK